MVSCCVALCSAGCAPLVERARRSNVGAASWLRAVSGLVGAAIEHAYLFFGDGLVEGQRFGLEVALRDIFRLEVMVRVLAAHQRRPVSLADGLLQPRRDIADRQADAPVIGTIG